MPDTTTSRKRAEWLPSKFLLAPALISLVFLMFAAPAVLAQDNDSDNDRAAFEDQIESESSDDNGSDNDNDSDNGTSFSNGGSDDFDSDNDSDDQSVTAQQYGGNVQTPNTGGVPLLPVAAAGMLFLGCSTLMLKRVISSRAG